MQQTISQRCCGTVTRLELKPNDRTLGHTHIGTYYAYKDGIEALIISNAILIIILSKTFTKENQYRFDPR